MKLILIGIVASLITIAIVIENNDGMLLWNIGIFAVSLFLLFLFSGYHSGKRLFGSFICSLVFFGIVNRHLSKVQGHEAEEKLRVIVKYLENYKLNNGKYPSNLNDVPKELKTSFLGLYMKPINVYEFNDTTFTVGWQYAERIFYDSEENWYINNRDGK